MGLVNTIHSIRRSVDAEMLPTNESLSELRGYIKYHLPYEPLDSSRLELLNHIDAIRESFQDIEYILQEMEDYVEDIE